MRSVDLILWCIRQFDDPRDLWKSVVKNLQIMKSERGVEPLIWRWNRSHPIFHFDAWHFVSVVCVGAIKKCRSPNSHEKVWAIDLSACWGPLILLPIVWQFTGCAFGDKKGGKSQSPKNFRDWKFCPWFFPLVFEDAMPVLKDSQRSEFAFGK